MARKIKARGLGKGLEALIPVKEDDGKNTIKELKVTEIEANKEQPRQYFEKESLNALAESIRKHGLVQPIIVRYENDRYQIVAGERRWRAARLAGLRTLPVIVKEYSNLQMLQVALIENLQREDLNPIEEANAYKSLIDEHKLSQEQIADSVGKSRSAIANSLRLLNLNDKVKKLLIEEQITAGHARALLAFDSAEQTELANRIIKEGLNVRSVEKLSKSKEKKKPESSKSPEIMDLEDRLRNILKTKVVLQHGEKKGKIEIEYYGLEDLDRILEILES